VKTITIAVDVDDVCADLLSEWLRRYNLDYGDSLLPEDITAWDLHQFVKPKCNKLIYEYLRATPCLYDNIHPIQGARAAVRNMRADGHRVIFVTSCTVGTVDAKMRWLIRWGFLPKGNHQRDFIAAADKASVKADVLIDDHVANVQGYPGPSILITRPHNLDIPVLGTRAPSLAEAYRHIAMWGLPCPHRTPGSDS
jgi:5'-nucleotidase